VRTAADDDFIDDECVRSGGLGACFFCADGLVRSIRGAAPADSDDEGAADLAAAPQAEEAREDHGSDDEIEAMFKPKSTRRRERTEVRALLLLETSNRAARVDTPFALACRVGRAQGAAQRGG